MEYIKVKDLLTSPIFQCKTCKRRLSHPIMDVPNIGNICGLCFKKNTYTNSTENTDISDILAKLQISCSYAKQGCSYEGLFAEVTQHEDSCRYRETRCPFSFINKCSGTAISSIVKHIKSEHLDNVHYYCSSTVTIEFPLEHAFEDFHLLSVNEEDHFLLRVQLDIVSNRCMFIIYDFNTNPFQFSIRHETEEFCLKSKNCIIMPELYLTPTFDYNAATSFSVSLLKQCFGTTATSVIEILNPTFQIPNSKLLKCLECPVCNEYMNVQIKQCNQGHSVCKVCRQKLQDCPLCKSVFGTTRNYTLESLSSLVQFPCKNSGCRKYMSGDEIEKHELECKYKHYQCPFLIKLNCKWKGLHEHLTEHLLTEHSAYTEFNNFVQRKILLDCVNHKYDTICIILGEHIFKVCVCINGSNKLFLTYGFYGPVNNRSKFIWETGIYHKNSEKCKFVVKDICSTYQTTNYKLDVEGYAVDNTIYFYHKISSVL